jgi:hypothetical protein
MTSWFITYSARRRVALLPFSTGDSLPPPLSNDDEDSQLLSVGTTGATITLMSNGASPSKGSDSMSNLEWRKKQLLALETRIKAANVSSMQEQPTPTPSTPDLLIVESENDLQPMWRAMESRVKNRRRPPLLSNESDPVAVGGRRNVKRTDEDVWLQEGLYDDERDDKSKDPR